MLVLSRHYISQEFNFLQMTTSLENPQFKLMFGQLQTVFDVGFIGVDIFFVISGIAITRSITGDRSNTLEIAPTDFVARRFFRLAPTYLFTLIISILIGRFVFPFPEYKSLGSIFGSFTLSNYINNLRAPNGVSWTLVYEIKFYLLILIILILNKYSRNFREIGARRILILFLLVWFICFAYSGMQNLTQFESNNYIFSFRLESSSLLNDFFLGSFGIYFMLGILIGLMRNRQDLFAAFPFLVLFISCAIFVLNSRISAELDTSQTNFVGMAIFIFSIILLVFGEVFNSRLQSSYLIEYLGKMTYSLYLLHLVAGLGFLKWMLSLGYPFSIAFIFTVIALFFVSYLIVKYIEDAYSKKLSEVFVKKFRRFLTT
jgi:peptidoglycan/LPS O-acetylase OafA/YrhL